jgi:hypothetical protein
MLLCKPSAASPALPKPPCAADALRPRCKYHAASPHARRPQPRREHPSARPKPYIPAPALALTTLSPPTYRGASAVQTAAPTGPEARRESADARTPRPSLTQRPRPPPSKGESMCLSQGPHSAARRPASTAAPRRAVARCAAAAAAAARCAGGGALRGGRRSPARPTAAGPAARGDGPAGTARALVFRGRGVGPAQLAVRRRHPHGAQGPVARRAGQRESRRLGR